MYYYIITKEKDCQYFFKKFFVFFVFFVAGKLISATYGDERPVKTVAEQPKQQDAMAIFSQAIKEMQELGFEKLEDYLAYKESETLNQPKKKTPVM